MEKLEFKLTLKEVPVILDGKNHVLRELNGSQKGKYLNKMSKQITLNEKGKISGFKDLAGLETALLSLCLYDEKDVLVPIEILESFPSSVLGKLQEAASELNGLNEKGQEIIEAEVKNE